MSPHVWQRFRALLPVLALFSGAAAYGQLPSLAPLPGTGELSQAAGSGAFTFVAGGDNRPAHKSCPQPPTPGEIFSAVRQMNPSPAFVLWTGDTISGKQPDKPD